MITQKQCLQCRTTFEGRSNRLYCSDSCKQRAFQQSQQAIPQQSERQPEAGRKQLKGSKSEASFAKADVEIARLRFSNEEKLKALEVEERDHERQHELTLQDRQFDQDLQRSDNDHTLIKKAWENERKELLHQIDSLGNLLTAKPLPVEEPEQDDESQSTGIHPLWWIAGGALLAGVWAKNQKPQPALATPTNPITKPPFSPLKNGLKTVSKTNM